MTFYLERWKIVPTLLTHEVSTMGRLRNTITQRLLGDGTNQYGYVINVVNVKGKKPCKIFLRHRLVAQTWIPNLENKPQVDHINQNRSDNRVANLRWATRKEQASNTKPRHQRVPTFGRMVHRICTRTNKIVQTFPSCTAAARQLNVTISTLMRWCNNSTSYDDGKFRLEFVQPVAHPDEQWTPIQHHEGYYISTRGRIKRPSNLMVDYCTKPKRRHQPYIKVSIQSKQYSLHILVARHFIPNPEGKKFVNHKDGNGWNPCADNLEWCTHSENMIHAHKNVAHRGSTSVWVTNCVSGEKRKCRSMQFASIELGFYKARIAHKFYKLKATTCQIEQYKFEKCT